MQALSSDPIRIYYYFDFSDPQYFCGLLESRFRASGHERPLVWIKWNCYDGPPGRDGDLFIYDAIVMSSLVDKGYLHPLPEIIDTSDVFDWVLDTTKVNKRTYGFPLILCANTLICRRADDRNVRNVMELSERIAVPLRSMLPYYYMQSFCNYQDRSDRYFEVMAHLLGLMGGKEKLTKATFRDYDGVRLFREGECRYFLGFTENLRFFEKGDYVVRLANFSDHEENQMPLFMADLISIGNDVREEKLLDCLDLMELAVDGSFSVDLCAQEGDLQYMMPACRSTYSALAALDPVYEQFYEMLDAPHNGVSRYGRRFYEEFEQRGAELLERLLE